MCLLLSDIFLEEKTEMDFERFFVLFFKVEMNRMIKDGKGL